MPLVIGGRSIAPGELVHFDLPVALLPTHTQMNLPLAVMRGRRPGPTVWLSAAVHGDELNGVEIISRVLEQIRAPLRRGALIAAPIVNVFGFIGQSRYLPDRRDLNRSFPGSRRGSLASRVAYVFMEEIVAHCTHGIDLHTAARDRSNHPHVRANLSDPETLAMARAFHAPVLLQSGTRPGSLRAAASKQGRKVIVFEGGEAQRFNEHVIQTGVRGVLSVLHALEMIRHKPRARQGPTFVVEDTTWLRARGGGVLRLSVDLGATVQANELIGHIADPFGAKSIALRAPYRGIVVGKCLNPVVHGGDAIVNLGRI